MENRQGGPGRAIGEVLLKDHEKLPLEGEGDENDPARMRLHKLVRACGRPNRKDRPEIGVVLAEAKSIFDSISKPGGYRLDSGSRRFDAGTRVSVAICPSSARETFLARSTMLERCAHDLHRRSSLVCRSKDQDPGPSGRNPSRLAF